MRNRTRPIALANRTSEAGQATTEYILMLAVAVGIFMIAYRILLKPVMGQLGGIFTQKIEKMFHKDGFHSFPMRGSTENLGGVGRIG